MNEDRQNRLDKANEVLKIISEHGRHFFRYQDRVAKFEFDKRGQVWYRDQYTDKLVWVYRDDLHWKGFTNGGTMRSLVSDLHKFVTKGTLVRGHFGPWPEWICGGDLWGYGEDMQIVRDKIKQLGITNE